MLGSLQSCRILVVDDCEIDQQTISLALRNTGAEITIVDNGKKAIDVVLRRINAGDAFHVILMDIEMPVMDGCRAAFVLRGNGYQEPIIAVTGHTEPGDREAYLAAGCDENISKPFDDAKLVELVTSVVAVPSTSGGQKRFTDLAHATLLDSFGKSPHIHFSEKQLLKAVD